MARRVALIANPKAGTGSFESVCERLVLLLKRRGMDAAVSRTTGDPGSAQRLAAAAAHTCDLVVACGGDGTVHEVLQALAGTATHLGVLPFGTANALARNLQLPMDPVMALETLLTFRARKIPLGHIETTTGTQYFLVMAGAGPDGGLIHAMSLNRKVRDGRRAYYALATRHFLTRRFPNFVVAYRLVGTNTWGTKPATAVMVSRVPDLGGLFRGLTTASRLHHPYLLLQMVAAPAHLALPAWFAFGKLGLERFNPWLTKLQVEEVRCTSGSAQPVIHTQVDGELAGTLPFTVGMSPSTAWLLMPDDPAWANSQP